LSFFTPKKDQCDTRFAYTNSSDLVRRENESEFIPTLSVRKKLGKRKTRRNAKQSRTTQWLLHAL